MASRRQTVRDRIRELSDKHGISREDQRTILECVGYAVEEALLDNADDQEPEGHIAAPSMH
ncbi:hypothetical protein K2P47_05165 [Patescibacteria group bacterium]|nr:hypothetical protein [Patescibacteria group bacterium]